MTQQDPDIAALAARLGLRGLHYRSFGNRPVAAMPTAPPPAEAIAAPAAPVAPLPLTIAATPPVPPPSLAAPAEAPPPPDFPLLAAALGRAAAPTAAPATEATLIFLGLRAAQGR